MQKEDRSCMHKSEKLDPKEDGREGATNKLKKVRHCSNCGKPGHTKKTCTEPPKESNDNEGSKTDGSKKNKGKGKKKGPTIDDEEWLVALLINM